MMTAAPRCKDYPWAAGRTHVLAAAGHVCRTHPQTGQTRGAQWAPRPTTGGWVWTNCTDKLQPPSDLDTTCVIWNLCSTNYSVTSASATHRIHVPYWACFRLWTLKIYNVREMGQQWERMWSSLSTKVFIHLIHWHFETDFFLVTVNYTGRRMDGWMDG